jgi:hypothetical protein
VPTVVVATTSFAALAHQMADTFGLPEARIAVVEHPLGGIDEDAVRARAEEAVEQVLELLGTTPGTAPGTGGA